MPNSEPHPERTVSNEPVPSHSDPVESRAEVAARPWVRLGAVQLLILVLVLVVALAIWGVLSGRREASHAVSNELELQTAVHARALEAQLANLRADVLFLSQSPPLLRLPIVIPGEDPVARRWGRLDAEGTLLLFLEANPAVERLDVRRSNSTVVESQIVAGRRRGQPTLLPPATPEPNGPGRLLSQEWRLGSSRQEIWRLNAWVRPDELLALVAPGFGDRLRVRTAADLSRPERGKVSVRVPVVSEHWQSAADLVLERREDEAQALRSVESLASSYRTTIGLYLTLSLLALILGWMAFRQVRRVARLEVENAQQAQIRELERQLMHSERLASVGRLAAGLAHEINNPLAGMANYLALLEEDLKRGDLEEAPDLIARLREGLDRTAGITRQTLRLSDPGRLSTPDSSPTPNPSVRLSVDLVEVLTKTVDFLRGNPDHRGIDFRLDVPDLRPRIDGDPITLGQLFLNLILNACQVQKGTGIVEVMLRVEEMARVQIADRGPGLTPETTQRLFEPFFSSRGSTGLGLAICRRIVEDHGGHIQGRNRQGGGAVFEVDLPLQPADPERTE